MEAGDNLNWTPTHIYNKPCNYFCDTTNANNYYLCAYISIHSIGCLFSSKLLYSICNLKVLKL